MDLRPCFGSVNRFGEPRQEKTRNEGEILRGEDDLFACFLSNQDVKVRFYGSDGGLRCIDRPKVWRAGTTGDWKGEGIRESDESAGSASCFCQRFPQR